MGNALNFQQKFENIRINKETQNYQGVWLEYGDLIHIMWDFEPLEDSALLSLDKYVSDLVNRTHFYEDPKQLTSSLEKRLVTTGMQYLVRSVN